MNRNDARELARLATLLERRQVNLDLQPRRNAEDDASELHAIARRLHRYDERNCSEDLGCPDCHGDGIRRRPVSGTGEPMTEGEPCQKCAGKGHTLGRREARAEARAVEIAARYQMRAYFQGDCRGCPLYLIPEEAIPTKVEGYRYDCDAENVPSLAALQGRWIASNYNGRGVAVCH